MALKPYNEQEVFRARVLKAYRAAIRLKHALAADDEIAFKLPKVEAAIDAALAFGEPVALDPAQIFSEEL